MNDSGMPAHPVQRSCFAIGVLILTLMIGCKTSPTNSIPAETAILAGTYVGSGNPGNGLTNILMEFNESDSTNYFTGAIRYQSEITSFEYIQVDSSLDTVRFRYYRNNVLHSAWGLIEAYGIPLHFTEPSGISEFRLNRELQGFNMSGQWAGLITSQYSVEPMDITMSMDQQGQLFFGTISAAIPYNAAFTFSSGVANESTFQLVGTVYISPYTIPVYWNGSYLAPDTITGSWQADDNPAYDYGQFLLYRPFE